MLDSRQLEAALSRRINAARLQHTRGVVSAALDLSARYGVNRTQAEAAALMHDYAKDLTPSELRRLGAEFGVITDPAEEAMPALLHAPVGAELLRRENLIADAEVLAAIRWHTTGAPAMSRLAQVIWLADLIEPGRSFPGVEQIRAAAQESLEKGLLTGLDYTMIRVINLGRRLHLQTVHTRNWLIGWMAASGTGR